ncbi:hypothetical protein [Bradyrhizobium sp. McL0615]|jgi:hypothetical protein|uniref:hypothetical protein n=1 Tax=Bradyrhizobium sp. McL0615 TaxID=3415673 RepID=UPI003CF0A3C3
MKWPGIVALVALAPIVYSLAFPSVTVRYRLTLDAEVDGAPKTGSGVIEVSYSKESRLAGQHPIVIHARGEAVALDLDSRGTVFALLKAGSDSRSAPEFIVFRAFNFLHGALPDPIDDGLIKLQQLSGKREIALSSLPMLVRFRDINDQMSVEKVDPFDLATSFGSGVRLTRATLEIVPAGIWPLNRLGITGEPITRGVEKRLAWLGALKGKYLGGGGSARGAPLELDSGDFKKG